MWALNYIEMSKSEKKQNQEWKFRMPFNAWELKCIQKFLSRFHFFLDFDISMPFNAQLVTRYILKSGHFLNMSQWFIPSDFIKRISNYGCYGYNRLKITSVATVAPPLVDSKHYNSFPFSPIWVDPLWRLQFRRLMVAREAWSAWKATLKKFRCTGRTFRDSSSAKRRGKSDTSVQGSWCPVFAQQMNSIGTSALRTA